MCDRWTKSSWFTSVLFPSWCHEENIPETEWLSPRHWLTSWRMTQRPGIASKFSLFIFLFSFAGLFPDNILPFLDADTNGKGPTPKQSTTYITITLQIMTNASFITISYLTLSIRFISTKESSVFFQKHSSPSRMSNYKQIPLSSSS